MNTLFEDELQKLITLSEKILKIYNKLYSLEINNEKNTDDYKKNLNYLDVLIELEDEIYSNLSVEDMALFISTIKEADSNLNLSDFSLLINDIKSSYALKRILNRLRLEHDKHLIDYLEKENNDEMVQSLSINHFIIEDILNAFIFESEESISKTDNLEYQKSLKIIKYILSFLNKPIENNLKDNFDIPNKIYLFSKQIKEQYEISDEKYKKILQNHYMKYINKEVNKIGKGDFDDNSYSYIEYKKILQINLIKAYLSLDKDNILLNRIICDKIDEDNLDMKSLLSYSNENIISLESERLNAYENNTRL